MPITRNIERQYPMNAMLRFGYADLTAATGLEAIELPANSIVVNGSVVVETAFNTSGGTTPADTLKLGDDASTTRYTATPVNLRTAGRTVLTLTGFRHTARTLLKVLWEQNADKTGNPSQGSGYIELSYIIEGRCNENV